jgi:hypothetical protein
LTSMIAPRIWVEFTALCAMIRRQGFSVYETV